MMHVRNAGLVAVAAAALLAGCAMSDDKLASMLVAPGKYELYTCPEIVEQSKANATRRRELEQLMAKAGVDSGGRLVSTLAYRPDYLTARGEMKDLQEAAAAKQCELPKIETSPPERS